LKCPHCQKSFNPYKYEIPDWIDQEAWDSFVKMRKTLKKPLSNRGIKMAITQLEGYKNEGYNITEIIDNSVFKCYLGLFPSNEQQARLINQREFRAAEAKKLNLPRCADPETISRVKALKEERFEIGRKLRGSMGNSKMLFKDRLNQITKELKDLNDGIVKLEYKGGDA